MLSPTYIQDALLRAQRAMLIISERIEDNVLYLYADIYGELRYCQHDIFILYKALSDGYEFRAVIPTYDAMVEVLISKCQEVDSFNSKYNTLNPNYQNISGNSGINVIVSGAGNIMQTSLVFPGDGETSYTFPELIGVSVLTVYRGTGTTLRARSGSPSDEYAQFNSNTGTITLLYPFSDGESLWVEYKTTS